MIARNLTNWPKDLKNVEGLALFALRWDEALFHYSIDTYRFRVLDVPGLCQELVHAITLHETGILSIRSLPPIRDELLTALQKDPLSPRLLGKKFDLLIAPLRDWTPENTDVRKMSFAASTTHTELDGQYQKALSTDLITAVLEGSEKRDILDLTGRYITESLRLGFSQEYLFRAGVDFFFAKRPITSSEDIRSFLAKFEGPLKKYTVVVHAPSQGRLLSTGLKDDEYLSYRKTLPQRLPANPIEQSYLSTAERGFWVFSDIAARDPEAAKLEAEDRISTAGAIVGFFIHKLRFTPSEDALVYEGEPPTSVCVVRPSLGPAMRRPDIPFEHLEKGVNELLAPFLMEGVEHETTTRLGGALTAHLAGTKANTPQDQFSNLWTAFETLVGSTSEHNTISTVLANAVPALCRKYLMRLARALQKELKRACPSALENAVAGKPPGTPHLEHFVDVLASSAHVETRKLLYRASNPLLCNRIAVFHDLLTSPKASLKRLLEHEERVRWHIQRIYRNRNMLIHGGISGPHVRLLVSNLHDYVDVLLLECVTRIAAEKERRSLEKVFFDFQIDYESYKQNLQEMMEKGLRGDGLARTIVFGAKF